MAEFLIYMDNLPKVPEESLRYVRETYQGLINYFFVLLCISDQSPDTIMAEMDATFIQPEDGFVHDDEANYNKHMGVIYNLYREFYDRIHGTIPFDQFLEDDLLLEHMDIKVSFLGQDTLVITMTSDSK